MRLIDGDYSCLLEYDQKFALELYTTMTMQMYIPRCVIEYKPIHSFVSFFSRKIVRQGLMAFFVGFLQEIYASKGISFISFLKFLPLYFVSKISAKNCCVFLAFLEILAVTITFPLKLIF